MDGMENIDGAEDMPFFFKWEAGIKVRLGGEGRMNNGGVLYTLPAMLFWKFKVDSPDHKR